MGRKLFLRASDGHQLGAYRADPPGQPRGRVVVIQEIFGVNRHIRSVCDRLAAAGYVALAPQVFDRIQRDFESGYSDAEVAKAREMIPRVDWAKLMLDVRAAVDSLKGEGPVAILGFCLGGTVSFLAATQFDDLTAAVSYYGGQVARHADNRPRCPVQMHFGELDSHIPMSDVNSIRSKRPESEVHVYTGAGHGFHCDERGSYEPRAARAAWDRSLNFLARHFGVPATPAEAARPMPAPTPRTPATPIAKQSAAAGARRKPSAGAKSKPKKAAKKSKAKPKKRAAKRVATKAKRKGAKKSKRRR